jgi:leucine dehydrogenase
MTYKAAAAGLDLGGGKGVICSPAGPPPSGEKRRALLLDFGDLVDWLGGRYVTAEDVGIAAEDLVAIAERTDHVTGLPPGSGGAGDPSPLTALGLEAAIRACLDVRFGHRDPAGRRIAVVGLGHVGEKLARRLAQREAELTVSDIDPRKRALARELGATWVAPSEAMLVQCDVLAPCALGGAIDAENAAGLRCAIVCGSANNQLAAEGLAELLEQRGILYAPDFIVNAGGLIQVNREIRSYSQERARELVLAIEANTRRVLSVAAERGVTPLRAARALAEERLEAARREPAVVA